MQRVKLQTVLLRLLFPLKISSVFILTFFISGVGGAEKGTEHTMIFPWATALHTRQVSQRKAGHNINYGTKIKP